MADGAYRALADAHARLDAAVVTAYGWPASYVEDAAHRNQALYDLNARIVAGEQPYEPWW